MFICLQTNSIYEILLELSSEAWRKLLEWNAINCYISISLLYKLKLKLLFITIRMYKKIYRLLTILLIRQMKILRNPLRNKAKDKYSK